MSDAVGRLTAALAGRSRIEREVGQGGMCPDGSDYYDCGECPWENDFECDVPQLCPPGSDVNDCT